MSPMALYRRQICFVISRPFPGGFFSPSGLPAGLQCWSAYSVRPPAQTCSAPPASLPGPAARWCRWRPPPSTPPSLRRAHRPPSAISSSLPFRAPFRITTVRTWTFPGAVGFPVICMLFSKPYAYAAVFLRPHAVIAARFPKIRNIPRKFSANGFPTLVILIYWCYNQKQSQYIGVSNKRGGTQCARY